VSNLYQGWKSEGALLKKIPEILFAIAGLALVQAAPAASATLFGETLDANITITGEDDNGFYALPVLVGPVVVGASGFSDSIPVFKQLTEDGFATASNQITAIPSFEPHGSLAIGARETRTLPVGKANPVRDADAQKVVGLGVGSGSERDSSNLAT
jgi:hypothetical protein